MKAALVWHHKRSKHTLQTSNCGTREFHKQELVPGQLLGGAVVQVSAVVHTGQRGQVFSRVSTNCRVGFFNSDIDTYMKVLCISHQISSWKQIVKRPFYLLVKSKDPDSKSIALKINWSSKHLLQKYCVFIHHISVKTEEPYDRAVGCLLVGSGLGRYKTLHFPIPIVALQLLWSVM